MDIPARLAALRSKMAEHGLDAYIITSADPHMSEYVEDRWKGREYISGFDGSAGTALITRDRAYLWTDSRYYIQAAAQLDGTGYTLMKAGQKDVPKLTEFVGEHLKGCNVGTDGRTISSKTADELRELCSLTCDIDLIGDIWTDRPAPGDYLVEELSAETVGETRIRRIERVREAMAEAGADHLVTAACDECAWLFGYRAFSKIYDPIPLAYAIVSADRVRAYIQGTLSDALFEALIRDGIQLEPYTRFEGHVAALTGKVWADRGTVNARIAEKLAQSGAELIDRKSPIEMMKAVKTEAEQAGMTEAHIRDGAALTRFIYGIKKRCAEGSISSYTELDAVQDMERLRGDQAGYIGPSFATIAAYGPHGAIVHYDPDEDTNIPCEARSFLLVDTGGQYDRGTTDVTRTIALGELTDEEKRTYTAVLRGHLALGAAVFPEGTKGQHIDALARLPLWEIGLDFGHGTGHGVGFISCVHEGPNSVSPRAEATFREGMVTSNEPGAYLEGKFGVRIEDLVLCRRREDGMLYFDTLTLAPFDTDAIVWDMLTDREIRLLTDYHRRVYDTLRPCLDDDTAEWLKGVTETGGTTIPHCRG
ncbi:MAG: aminopeptidase P family protein [Oscillospiraceae bacterium]|nr:aminopeptidase P family protein [Oscillospiraceae bacterium]